LERQGICIYLPLSSKTSEQLVLEKRQQKIAVISYLGVLADLLIVILVKY